MQTSTPDSKPAPATGSEPNVNNVNDSNPSETLATSEVSTGLITSVSAVASETSPSDTESSADADTEDNLTTTDEEVDKLVDAATSAQAATAVQCSEKWVNVKSAAAVNSATQEASAQDITTPSSS